MRKNGKKKKILAFSYLTALVAALGLAAWVCHGSLADYRLAARYSADQAFEEAARSVTALSEALEKSVYATDGPMCGRLCSEAYANALAAETAVATLPFATQELEQLSGFLNVAGDYAYTLAFEAVTEGFSREQLENLRQLSGVAAEFSGVLEKLRGSLSDGSVIMDSREIRLSNVDSAEGTELPSARLLAYEQSFQPLAKLEYDGLYGAAAEEPEWRYTKDEMKELAAAFTGVEPEDLELRYEYEDDKGWQCYQAGETLICVSPRGVESLSQSRLVGEDSLSADQALEIAEDFLAEQGFEKLELRDSRINGAVALLHFAAVEGDAVCLDNQLSVAVALDDGSIYGFNAAEYRQEPSGLRWTVDQAQAEQALPEGLKPDEARKVVIQSPGKQNLPCYEFRCTDGDRQLLLYVNGETGRQSLIKIIESGETA